VIWFISNILTAESSPHRQAAVSFIHCGFSIVLLDRASSEISLLKKKGEGSMDTSNLLKDKVVLVVDDEVDVTDTVGEVLDMCFVRKANDYDTGRQYLMSFTFDIVILDIMGVNGFELLKLSVKRGFPTVMLTAYALTPEALEKSIKLGAVSFLPKEKMSELDEFLADVVLKGGQPVWGKLFDKLGGFFNKHFGPDWKQRNQFFEDFERSLKAGKGEEP
jgi:CheY-like chemotaxis protein